MSSASPQQKNQRRNDFIRYSSLAFEMIIIIGAGTFGGVKLDEKFQTRYPVYTIILSFSSVIIAIYFAIKDFLKKDK